MKKTIMYFGVASFFLASCGGPDKAAYADAADSICKCMEQKMAEQAAEQSEIAVDFTDLNFALCALDVASKVDPFTDDMGNAINEKCPQWKKAYETYKKAN
jgi:hypothetical protein